LRKKYPGPHEPYTEIQKAELRSHVQWMRKFGMDYLIYLLGNRCSFCGTQIDLEVDHMLPKLFSRKEVADHSGDYYRLFKEYLEGEPLRVLVGRAIRSLTHYESKVNYKWF
jgi:hypothetical protein